MTDQHVSPAVTESEMNAVQNIFQRMATTIVEASKLSNDVIELRQTVEAMKRDLESQRNNNAWLDSQLAETRKERDEAKTRAADAEREHETYKSENDRLTRLVDQKTSDIAYLSDQVSSLKRERDDAHFRVLELEDKLKESDGRWGKLRELFGDGGQPKPEPTPTPVAEQDRSTSTPWDSSRF